MRAIKNLMRAKKPMWNCGECKCVTLNAWRCADEFCNCGDASVEDMVEYGLNWFKSTPVFKDLDSAEQEEALANAQAILEGAGEGIAPFYNAVKSGKTFAYYVDLMGLDVDESGPCDSSIYEDNEAFIIYISAMGAVHCKYLALVATRGLSPDAELINKEELAAYFDWLTTSDVTYTFKDWDDEILSFGSVEKGGTPETPSNPSREGYNFTGWSPAVGPISEDTTYVAQYEPAVILVQSIAVVDDVVNPTEGGTTNSTFNYTPLAANDFSNITFDINPEGIGSYDGLVTAEITSHENGVGIIAVTGITAGIYGIRIYINGEHPESGAVISGVVSAG